MKTYVQLLGSSLNAGMTGHGIGGLSYVILLGSIKADLNENVVEMESSFIRLRFITFMGT